MGDLQHLGVTAVWADHLNAERQHRNVIDNTERGLKFSLGDVGWAQADQTAVCKRFAAFFKEVDVLICPAASVSPIPLSRLCVEEINDKRMATYMRWLAIAYAPTMALACAATLPCGVDHLGAAHASFATVPRDDAGSLIIVLHTDLLEHPTGA